MLVLFVGALVCGSSATATHMRPKAATPFYTQLVPAYHQCTVTNSTHNGGLTGVSCQIGGVGKGAPESQNLEANLTGPGRALGTVDHVERGVLADDGPHR